MFKVIKVVCRLIGHLLQMNLPRNSACAIRGRRAMVVITLCIPFSERTVKVGMKFKEDIKNFSY